MFGYNGMKEIVFVLVALASIVSCSHLSQRVENCFQNSIKHKNWKKKLEQEPFQLNSKSSFEIFSALTQNDLKRIEYLEECVRKEDSSLFELWAGNAPAGSLPDRHLGRGNVTHLTGMFQHVLPDVRDKILTLGDKMIKELKWPELLENLGIRSVRVVSVDSGNRMKSKAELQAEKKAHEASKASFVVVPIDEEEGFRFDPLADENVVQYMKEDRDSVYTLVAALTSRDKYHGGSLLVHTLLDEEPSYVSESDEYDDDEEEEEDAAVHEEAPGAHEDNETAGHAHSDHRHRHRKREPQYNAVTSKIDRHTPDLGHLVFIQSHYRHGFYNVTRGFNKVLVMEFWAHADATGEVGGNPSPVRATAATAKPFVKRVHKEL